VGQLAHALGAAPLIVLQICTILAALVPNAFIGRIEARIIASGRQRKKDRPPNQVT
jgi:hypothetical protein